MKNFHRKLWRKHQVDEHFKTLGDMDWITLMVMSIVIAMLFLTLIFK